MPGPCPQRAAAVRPERIQPRIRNRIPTLLVKNLTFFADMHFTTFTNSEYQDMFLTLCMGLHPRLGQKIIMLALTNDLLRVVCEQICASEQQKHTICQNQEKWLYQMTGSNHCYTQ
jgi:hypothetical protein